MFARDRMLCEGGKVWLPNIQSVQVNLTEFRNELEVYFETYFVDSEDLCLNPLYLATEHVDELLEGLPDGRTNTTQMEPYHAYSDHPFVVLVIKNAYAAPIVIELN